MESPSALGPMESPMESPSLIQVEMGTLSRSFQCAMGS